MWLSLRNGGCDLHPVKRGEEVKSGGGGDVAYTPYRAGGDAALTP